jgi:peptide deformylase
MVLPIISYGQSVLRQKCNDVAKDYPNLDELIDSMWETLYPADGSGLAAPQVNHLLKLFIVDSKDPYERMEQEDRDELYDGDCGIKETFINAKIIKYSDDDTWFENEGCLSLPTLSEEVERPWGIEIEYFDRNFQKHSKIFRGITARIIQHEYDHTEGKLYIDYVKPIRRKLLNGKLKKISKGEIGAKYKMRFIK